MLIVLSTAPPVTARAPALNAPSALPSDSAAYGDLGLRITVLLQVRADFPETEREVSTFVLRKAEVGLRARVEELLSSASQPFVDRSAVSDRFALAEEVGPHLESRWDQWLFQMSLTAGGRAG